MRKNIISFLIGIILGLIIYVAATHSWTSNEPKEISKTNYEEVKKEHKERVLEKALGAEPDSEFTPGYYEFNPCPDAIRKNIEATAYCYGTTTCTGKKVREGYAAMSKRHLGMTAVVYEADANGEPIDYIGTYEIEDTGGDYRIQNGNCIDIYIPDRQAAIEFGRKQVVVYLIEAKG